ncbi:MAG TPA: hypothetical protein VGI80_09065 [Pyrinomonadaceae bacterium]|jgi:hypothetical protein
MMTLERDFLKFTAGPSGYERDRLRVTINTKGEIYMNRKTFAEMGKPEAANLYYSAARQVIAIEPANARSAEAFKFRQRGPSGGGRFISAQRLCRHHRIVIKHPEAFTRPEINADGILLLDLQETTRVGGWTMDGSDGDAKREEQRRQREERRTMREQKQLARAREKELAARNREQQQRRRSIDKRNAAETAHRTREIARSRETYNARHGIPDSPQPEPKRKYRAAGF